MVEFKDNSVGANINRCFFTNVSRYAFEMLDPNERQLLLAASVRFITEISPNLSDRIRFLTDLSQGLSDFGLRGEAKKINQAVEILNGIQITLNASNALGLRITENKAGIVQDACVKRPFHLRTQRSSVDTDRQREQMQALFAQDLEYAIRQKIMDGVNHSDFMHFRERFRTFSQLLGGAKKGGASIAPFFAKLDLSLKTHEVATGKVRTSTGFTRFVCERDFDCASLIAKKEAIQVIFTNPSETPDPIS